MKREACALLEEISGNLNIATQVTLKAKEIFAKYRDLKEAVHNYEGTVAACLVIAYEDLSMEMNLEEVNKKKPPIPHFHLPPSNPILSVSRLIGGGKNNIGFI